MKGEFRRQDAEAIGQQVLDWLKGYCKRLEIAGSVRRRCDVVGDVDVVAVPYDTEAAMAMLQKVFGAPEGSKVQASFEMSLEAGEKWIQVDVWFVPEESWGAALLFTTGSAMFNIGCRSLAKSGGMKLSRYALEDRETGQVITQGNERLVLRHLGLDFVPPVERSVEEMRDFWRLVKRYQVRGLTDEPTGFGAVAFAGDSRSS